MSSQKLVPIFDNLNYLENPFRHGFQLTDGIEANVAVSIKKLKTDALFSAQFLYTYRGSLDTFASYRREIERFLQWCWLVEGLTLDQVRRQHIEAFVHFCQSPPKQWIGTKSVQRFQSKEGLRAVNPEWRPFVVKVTKREHKLGTTADPKNYDLSQSALQALFSVLSTFFNYLIQEDAVALNPLRKYGRKVSSCANARVSALFVACQKLNGTKC